MFWKGVVLALATSRQAGLPNNNLAVLLNKLLAPFIMPIVLRPAAHSPLVQLVLFDAA